MTYRNLIKPMLTINWFTVIEYIHSKVFWKTILNLRKFFPIFVKFYTQRCLRMISWAYNNLFFENDPVLPGLIAIGVLNWLSSNYFFKTEIFMAWLDIHLYISFGSIVRHNTFDNKSVSKIVLRQLKVLNIQIVKSQMSLCLIRWSWFIYNFSSHIAH